MVTFDEDLAGQIHLGKNELVLRAVKQGGVPAEAKLEADAVMNIQVSCSDGKRGMLDTGAGISVMSVSAWRRIGSPTLSPWTTAIKMANDAPINVFGTIGPLNVRMAGLDLRVEFVVVEDLEEDGFLLGRTFFREFDVLIDLRENKITIRDVNARRRLCRKETMGSFNECWILVQFCHWDKLRCASSSSCKPQLSLRTISRCV